MRRLLVNLSLSLAVSVALLVLVEGGARLVERRRPPRPEVADYIWDWDDKMPGGFYVMKSEAAGWPPWEEFNGDGLRDRTRPHERPDLVHRVAVLGDSVTLGADLRPEQAFPRVLEARLQAEGRPVEVMNVALWGWSTRQERTAWQRIGRLYHPDAVLLARLQQARERLLGPELRAERDAVPEHRHPPDEVGLLVRPRAVAQAVAVELLPGRPADRLGLHHVEAARHLVVPVPDVVGHLGPRRPPALQQAGAALQQHHQDDRDRQAQGQVAEQPAHQAGTAARRSAGTILSQWVPSQ